MAGLKASSQLQGKSIVKTLDDPSAKIRDVAFSVSVHRGVHAFLLRTDKWAYIQYGEDAKSGMELYNMEYDAKQYNNLANNPQFQDIVQEFQAKLKSKLEEVRDNDLGIAYNLK